MVTLESWFSVWIDRFLSCLGGIKLGPGYGNNPTANMPNMSDDFWSTSTCDPDDRNTVQSRQIISSISTGNHNPNQGGNHSDFVNHGSVLWNQSRLRWIGTGESPKQTKRRRHPKLSWYMTKEILLETKRPFHHRIALSDMVEFLVEEWEEEGLYF